MHATELFQRYDLQTGKLLNVVSAGEFKEVPKPLTLSNFTATAAAAPEKAPKPLRVLFIGNSQISSICDLPEIVEDLSRSAAPSIPRIESDEVVIGGATLAALWKNGMAAKKIEAGGWSWVVCHEIVYSYGGNSAGFQDAARKFDALAKKTGAKLLYYATADVENARRQHQIMYMDAAAMARESGGRVAGGGMAWLKIWSKQPKYDLHHTDRASEREGLLPERVRDLRGAHRLIAGWT